MEDGAPLMETLTSAVSELNLPHNTGTFFPHARHFNIAGGTYTSHVTQVAPTVRHGQPLSYNSFISAYLKMRDFRMLPLGDLDLLHEIRLEDGPGMITRQRLTGKLYHVRLDGRVSTMTAAVYEGDEGEQAWRRELQTFRNSSLYPLTNIVTTSTSMTLRTNRSPEPILPIVPGKMRKTPQTILLPKELLWQSKLSFTPWIRQSTSGLAIEILSKGGEEFEDNILALPMHYIPRHRAHLGTNSDSIIVSSLDFQDFCDLLSGLSDDRFFTWIQDIVRYGWEPSSTSLAQAGSMSWTS
ncbi:hypothetical protein K438DRAFT_1996711 [Mycena galopus ATCC 62051]|nr:hypothetical protein K438DRAFT_1996711 [Mycena galopus ATCC 62051]